MDECLLDKHNSAKWQQLSVPGHCKLIFSFSIWIQWLIVTLPCCFCRLYATCGALCDHKVRRFDLMRPSFRVLPLSIHLALGGNSLASLEHNLCAAITKVWHDMTWGSSREHAEEGGSHMFMPTHLPRIHFTNKWQGEELLFTHIKS